MKVSIPALRQSAAALGALAALVVSSTGCDQSRHAAVQNHTRVALVPKSARCEIPVPAAWRAAARAGRVNGTDLRPLAVDREGDVLAVSGRVELVEVATGRMTSLYRAPRGSEIGSGAWNQHWIAIGLRRAGTDNPLTSGTQVLLFHRNDGSFTPRTIAAATSGRRGHSVSVAAAIGDHIYLNEVPAGRDAWRYVDYDIAAHTSRNVTDIGRWGLAGGLAQQSLIGYDGSAGGHDVYSWAGKPVPRTVMNAVADRADVQTDGASYAWTTSTGSSGALYWLAPGASVPTKVWSTETDERRPVLAAISGSYAFFDDASGNRRVLDVRTGALIADPGFGGSTQSTNPSAIDLGYGSTVVHGSSLTSDRLPLIVINTATLPALRC